MDFQEVLKAYTNSDSYLSVSENTKDSYKHLINRLAQVKTIPDIQNDMQLPVAVAQARSHLTFWSNYIRSLPISNSEKNRTRVMLKVIYNSMCVGHLVAPIKMDDHTKREKKPLSRSVVESLAQVPNLKKHFVVLLRFSFYTGLRPSEVRELKWACVNDKFITVMGSKGREKGKPSRMVAIGTEIAECLEYCKANKRSEYVFSGERCGQLNKDVVCAEMAAIRKAVGIEGVLYDARRGIATEMHKAGVDIRRIGDLLGHKNTNTTMIYINMTMEEKALAVAHHR